MDFAVYYDNQRKLIENFLETRMAKKGISKVDDAMAYSLLAGGKRIRPVLLMATAEALGKKGYNYLSVACGLEMIHTYSLIHDDLPCMDDDDYRRGRLTNHKVFGEAMAVLAGDGLLTLAFEVMLEQKNVEPAVLIEVVREMAMCAGNYGMVGGQGLDLEAEGKEISAEELRKLHAGKTGALFIGAVCAAIPAARFPPPPAVPACSSAVQPWSISGTGRINTSSPLPTPVWSQKPKKPPFC
ncbi:MAG: polyprenyl synthetase family protein [Phascolarctobacterium sp.]|nr:polyprenyl synthetase family protein [Phascolarctobacterium sp.]